MKCNGFNNLSYGKLVEIDIIKISKGDLLVRMFNDNYYRFIKSNIYEHEIVEYPMEEQFDLFKYISIQKTIRFKYDGVLEFLYMYGEYAIIDDWMDKKTSSYNTTRRILCSGSICEENKRVLSVV